MLKSMPLLQITGGDPLRISGKTLPLQKLQWLS